MKKEKEEPFILSLDHYIVPPDVQGLHHPENSVDLSNLNQKQQWRLFATEKGLQDAATHLYPDSCQTVTRVLDFHLPPFLTPPLWNSYRLSLARVLSSIGAYHSLHLWSLCILLKLNLCIQSIKPSYANSMGVICAAKAQAKQRLNEYLQKNYPRVPYDTFFETTADFPDDRHRPRLPVFLVSAQVMDKLVQSVPPRQLFEDTPLRYPVPYKTCYVIRGKKYIAFELHASPSTGRKRKITNQKFVLLVRIVSGSVYFYTYGGPTSLSLDPLYIRLRDSNLKEQIFCGIDECVYVTDEKSSEAPCPKKQKR